MACSVAGSSHVAACSTLFGGMRRGREQRPRATLIRELRDAVRQPPLGVPFHGMMMANRRLRLVPQAQRMFFIAKHEDIHFNSTLTRDLLK